MPAKLLSFFLKLKSAPLQQQEKLQLGIFRTQYIAPYNLMHS